MEVRIDKWLWAVRIYKTRSDATDACKNGRVTINGALTKASRDVKVGDVITVRKSPVVYSFRVLEMVTNRQPAREVPKYMENITPQEELEKLFVNKDFFMIRDRGTGRPTKKERRDIEDVMDSFMYQDEDDE